MKKTLLSIVTLLFVFVAFAVNLPEKNVELKESTTISSDDGQYCEGYHEGYMDGWKEIVGTRGSGDSCRGDVSDCNNTSDPYKCGYSQGYKKGTKDGRRACPDCPGS
jgi:hypothetical protein